VLNHRVADPLILVVGEDGSEYDYIRSALEPYGYRVAAAPDIDAGLVAVRRDRPAAVLAGCGAAPAPTMRRLIGLCRLGTTTPIALVGPELARIARQEHVPCLPTHADPAMLRAAVERLLTQ
jgi:CheY-like chemotaxis protein